MEIAGNKVVLRPVEEQDREMLMNLIADPEIVKVTGGYFSTSSGDLQMNWLRAISNSPESLYEVIADRDNPRMALGIIILSHDKEERGKGELYIKLMNSARKKGYGEDAVNTLVSHAFCEQGINCIYSNVLEDNTASRRLFEKCHFKQEGVYKSSICKNGYYKNVCIYRIRR